MDDFVDSEEDMTQSPSLSQSPTGPYVRIIEQPAKCGVRFRYECEGRISGAIPGALATTISPTYPTIQVVNYHGKAKVVVSCITKNLPYRTHPHNLVGKKSCKDGVCIMYFDNKDMICSFTNLGILCAKRKDIKERLRMRESQNIDPFETGFGHKSQALKMIDLAVVRLCFQVYLECPDTGEYSISLDPVVSDPIYDKKAMSELSIAKLSHYSAPFTGGTEVILLCDRVIKDDIQIRFFEERNDHLVWESFAEFKSSDIHKHFAISFRTPKYCEDNIHSPVAVNVQLRRPSDGGTSESVPFYLLPKAEITHKKQRIASIPYQMKTAFTSNYRNGINSSVQLSGSMQNTTIYTPRLQQQSHEYILPRLLSQHIVAEILPEEQTNGLANMQSNDFLDLDIGIMEDGINDIAMNGNGNGQLVPCSFSPDGSYWGTNDVNCKDMNGVNMNTGEYVLSSSEDILDISGNTNIKQWASQKQFMTAQLIS